MYGVSTINFSKSDSTVYAIFGLMICSAPFYWLQLYGGNTVYYFLIGALLACTGVLVLLDYSHFRLSIVYLLLFLLMLLGFCIIAFAHGNGGLESEMLRYNAGFLVKCSMVLILISSDRKYLFANLYVKLSVILSILVLVTLMMVLLGFWPFEYYHQPLPNKYVYNFITTFSSSVRVFGSVEYPRMSSFLDEPGSFSFMLAIAILINNRFTRLKHAEIILITTGLLTFSLAFFIFTFLYIFFKDSKRSHVAFYYVTIAVVTTFLYVVSDMFASLLDQILFRMTWDDDKGSIGGDNRFISAQFPKDMIFGDGLIGGRDSIIGEVNNIGVFGLLISYTPLYVIAFRSLIYRELARDAAFLVCVFALLLQRPALEKLYVFLPLYYYMHAMSYGYRKT
mgnify:CR=1 FL=1|tara:strand:- start:4818 stop:5999 length:1182 start_codon:yes stop_codon:yes gene_type:complete